MTAPVEGSPPISAAAGRSWRRAVACAALSLGCALALGGLSAWFLGAVALAGMAGTALTFNFHAPGALVRLFAIGRTVARYGERVLGHRAALSWQVARRGRLFAAMAQAPAVRTGAWQLGDEARLTDFLDDVEDLDFAPLRVDLPRLTFAGGAALCLAATAVLAPPALLPIFGWAGLCLRGQRLLRRQVAGQVAAARAASARAGEGAGAAAAAVLALRAEGRWAAAMAPVLSAFADADRHRLALRRAEARAEMLAALGGPLAAAAVLTAAWVGGARAEALLPAIFLAFAWFALAEALQGIARQGTAAARRTVAASALARWHSDPDPLAALPLSSLASAPVALCHPALPRLSPGGRVLGPPLALELRQGAPVVLTGPSGCGKTSLLKQVAGWIGDETFTTTDAGPLSAAERRALTAYCPHDAAVLSDTLRANLFAPAATDAALWAALDAVELGPRLREGGGLDAWLSQDVLSLGEAQRLNLARVLLSDRPVICLDEPAEHLDRAQGARILDRLIRTLSDRILVIASHLPIEGPGVRSIALDPRGVSPRSAPR